MTAPNSSHAVVIGASVAGLLAASALSEHYPRVTLYDRDVLPERPGGRRGTPQSRQLHALHARGGQTLNELLPGFRDEMIAAGAVTADPQRDTHWYLDDYLLRPAPSGLESVGLSRPVLEWLIRGRVARLPGVKIADATDVAGLTVADGRVTGVRVRRARALDAAEQTVPADLVVDAAGRGSRTPAWLAQLGLPVPATSRVRSGVTYVSRLYTRDPEQLDGRFGAMVTPYPGKPRGGAVLRQEGDRFVVLLAGLAGAEPPADEAGLLAFAEDLACPDLASVMRESTPLGDPVKYTHPESAWHHYETLRFCPGGFLVCGDAFSSFNPVYGQGITVAALEALALRELLSGPSAASSGLGHRYFRAAGELVAEAWETSASNDLRFPEVEGERRRGAALINAYGDRYRAAASVDPVLGTTFLRVVNMLDKPATLLSPGHVMRVIRSARQAVRAGA